MKKLVMALVLSVSSIALAQDAGAAADAEIAILDGAPALLLSDFLLV